MKDTLNDLIRSAGVIKAVRRTGWIKKAGIKNAESVADHSYRMALIGLVIGTELGLDTGKVARMCLIHDLAESKIGDLMPEEKIDERSHRKKEDVAMRRIISTLPRKSRRLLTKDWRELLTSKSKEARFVWQIDKLELGIQMKDYIASGYSPKLLMQFDPSELLTPEVRRILRRYR